MSLNMFVGPLARSSYKKAAMPCSGQKTHRMAGKFGNIVTIAEVYDQQCCRTREALRKIRPQPGVSASLPVVQKPRRCRAWIHGGYGSARDTDVHN